MLQASSTVAALLQVHGHKSDQISKSHCSSGEIDTPEGKKKSTFSFYTEYIFNLFKLFECCHGRCLASEVSNSFIY